MQPFSLGLELRLLTHDLRCLVCPQSIRYSDIVCELTQLVACLQTLGYRVEAVNLPVVYTHAPVFLSSDFVLATRCSA